MITTCIKGSRYHGLIKGFVYQVIKLNLVGDSPTIIIRVNHKLKRFYIPMVHKNKVPIGQPFNVNTGDPTKKAKLILGLRSEFSQIN